MIEVFTFGDEGPDWIRALQLALLICGRTASRARTSTPNKRLHGLLAPASSIDNDAQCCGEKEPRRGAGARDLITSADRARQRYRRPAFRDSRDRATTYPPAVVVLMMNALAGRLSRVASTAFHFCDRPFLTNAEFSPADPAEPPALPNGGNHTVGRERSVQSICSRKGWCGGCRRRPAT